MKLKKIIFFLSCVSLVPGSIYADGCGIEKACCDSPNIMLQIHNSSDAWISVVEADSGATTTGSDDVSNDDFGWWIDQNFNYTNAWPIANSVTQSNVYSQNNGDGGAGGNEQSGGGWNITGTTPITVAPGYTMHLQVCDAGCVAVAVLGSTSWQSDNGIDVGSGQWVRYLVVANSDKGINEGCSNAGLSTLKTSMQASTPTVPVPYSNAELDFQTASITGDGVSYPASTFAAALFGPQGDSDVKIGGVVPLFQETTTGTDVLCNTTVDNTGCDNGNWRGSDGMRSTPGVWLNVTNDWWTGLQPQSF